MFPAAECALPTRVAVVNVLRTESRHAVEPATPKQVLTQLRPGLPSAHCVPYTTLPAQVVVYDPPSVDMKPALQVVRTTSLVRAVTLVTLLLTTVNAEHETAAEKHTHKSS